MPFIEIIDKKLRIDTSAWDEKALIEGFLALVEKRNFDVLNVSCGVNPSPDFGYLELGDRFWRASLCIYFFGASEYFWERGVGYPEPWLFNTRHSIELYLKGFSLYAFWFTELKDNFLSLGHRTHLNDLKNYFKKPHRLYELYEKYKTTLQDVIKRWDIEELPDHPELDKMLLSIEGEELLKEIDEADKTGFRFRYPSLKETQTDVLQELNWRYDESQLLPKTGLSRKAGMFFDHLKVINGFHKLVQEMKTISSYLSGCWDYVGQMQDIALDLAREFYSE